jgi:hypothetical protein
MEFSGRFSLASVPRMVLTSMLHAAVLEDVAPAGPLRVAAERNRRRLGDPEFRFEATIRASTVRESPGDWVGRALLAQTLYARLFRAVPPHLDEFVARLPETCNVLGYIGEIHPRGTADENQIGGHNMLLRGLSEYYFWREDPRALAAIRGIVRNLMIPARPLFAQYPAAKLADLVKPEAVGLTVRQPTGPWRGLSTDIGTVFFTLDGLTQAYRCERDPALRALIETMVARYAEIDPVKIGAQTHATLTSLRGIFRWWQEVDPRPELLALVRERFARYRQFAQTETHANYNWFGRPAWTEPCAVVDSFMLSMQLWSATDDAELLEEAHRIFYNAFLPGQRPNGGFGCDVCVGAEGRRHWSPFAKIFEAPWCCSMRAAEGFATAATAAWWHNGSDAITLPLYFDGTARVHLAEGDLEFELKTDYPAHGRVVLRVLRGRSRQPIALRWFAPSWSPAGSFRITRNARTLAVMTEPRFATIRTPVGSGDEFVAEFDVRFGPIPLQNAGRQPGEDRYAHGPLLLGVEARDADGETVSWRADDTFSRQAGYRYRCARTGVELAPLPLVAERTEAAAKITRMQVVFPPPPAG